MSELFIDLDDLRTVNELCKICDKYRNHFETDIVCGRYIVDGCSVLGVASMLGRKVMIRPLTSGKCDDFVMKMVSIGAYIKNKE